MTFLETLLIILFYAVPLGVIAWFIVSLVLFLRRDKSNAKQCNRRKFSLLLSSLLLGVMVLAVIALMILISISIAHM